MSQEMNDMKISSRAISMQDLVISSSDCEVVHSTKLDEMTGGNHGVCLNVSDHSGAAAA